MVTLAAQNSGALNTDNANPWSTKQKTHF
uniref:Uncharacterized protein n=1 Tax=Anguilla anguilla TaxID=7936 RepID=A0A0E9QJZ1_ANGAN